MCDAFAIGTGPVNESEDNDRTSFNLPGHQQELLADLLANAPKGVPIVLLLFSAGPLNIVDAANSEAVRAILQCTFPAQTTGTAIYNVQRIFVGVQCTLAYTVRCPHTIYCSIHCKLH